MAVWDPERTLDCARAQRLIQAQFPGRARTLSSLGAGWDNTAFWVDEGWVVRFPRRQVAVPLLEREARVLPRLARQLPLPIPVPEWFGEPTDAFPWPWLGYRGVPGQTACRVALDPQQRAGLAAPLGRFLAALHAVEPIPGLLGDVLQRTDLARRRPKLLAALAQGHAAGLTPTPDAFADLIDELHGALPGRGCVVHGDLYARHLMVHDGALSGVIDWGDVHLGHPGLDLVPFWTVLPAAARPAFLAAYGSVDSETWRVSRLRALWSSAMLVSYGLDVGDAPLVRAGVRGLEGVLQA